jgi:DNA-directed RNA polymerase subunit RPC12/RpoP
MEWIIKNYCAKCGQKFQNSEEHYEVYGNFCVGCSKIIKEKVEKNSKKGDRKNYYKNYYKLSSI